MRVDASVYKDNYFVDFSIRNRLREIENGPIDQEIVLHSDASDEILFYINADGVLVVEFVDVNEDLHILAVCYADKL